MRTTTCLCIHPGGIRFEKAPDPQIEKPAHAIVRVVRSCICRSDPWPYREIDQPATGSTIGHKCVGEVSAAILWVAAMSA